MFVRILKKDLKRKKTMNIILLLFVILSSMFASSAVNNILAVTGGIDYYFDKSDVPDVCVQLMSGSEAEKALTGLPEVKSIRKEPSLVVYSSKLFTYNGRKMDNFISSAAVLSDACMGINYFDSDDKLIEKVEKGCFYGTSQFVQDTDIAVGDTVHLKIGDTEKDLKYMGRLKGALLYSETTASPVLLLDKETFEEFAKEPETVVPGITDTLLMIKTDDPDAIVDAAAEYEDTYAIKIEEYRKIYTYDMLSAYIMMAISILLMITAFVVLRFTIGFTITEEYREIGVMKAIGLTNGSIRGMYIVKYTAIAAIGAVIGYLGSIPLGNAMMKTVSENMVLGRIGGNLLGIVSSTAVVVIILLFCYGCTRRVNKLSPIDAVRSGQTGERFGKRGILKLGSSKLSPTGFLAVNDILSAPRQFARITVIFTLCVLMMTIMSNCALTLKSEKIRWLFDIPECEAHIMDTEYVMPLYLGEENPDEMLERTEKLLSDNGMPGKCTMTTRTRAEIAHGDKSAVLALEKIVGDTDDKMIYDEGSAPVRSNEIATTGYVLDQIGAQVGDKITATVGDKMYEFIITGKYSSFMTDTLRTADDFDINEAGVTNMLGVQIHFDGDPDRQTIDKNISKLKDLINSDKVYDTSEWINNFTQMSDTLNTIKRMMMILTVIVTSLIVILMERSFISKEKSEIALMKAIGISNGSIIMQHTARFVLITVFSCIVASAAVMPISNRLMNMVCRMIGDVKGISCEFDPLEIFAVCPAIILIVSAVGTFLTALYTKTITASDTASIE